MPKIYPFCSSSKGNCTLYMGAEKVLLIDCGVPFLQITRALETQGKSWEDVGAVLLTHAHSDHIKAIPQILKHTRLPFYGSAETLAAAKIEGFAHEGKPFSLFGSTITPITTYHDAAGSCGYRFDEGEASLALVTDTGKITPAMLQHLGGCSLIMLESNYDPDMLEYGPYPSSLKARVRGERGHLSNGDCAALLALNAMKGELKTAVLAHLSDHNNTPLTAKAAIMDTFSQYGIEDVQIEVAGPWCPTLEV